MYKGGVCVSCEGKSCSGTSKPYLVESLPYLVEPIPILINNFVDALAYVVILGDKRVQKSFAHGASRAATFVVAAWRDIKSSTGRL